MNEQEHNPRIAAKFAGGSRLRLAHAGTASVHEQGHAACAVAMPNCYIS